MFWMIKLFYETKVSIRNLFQIKELIILKLLELTEFFENLYAFNKDLLEKKQETNFTSE